jgi:hypothetical protein
MKYCLFLENHLRQPIGKPGVVPPELQPLAMGATDLNKFGWEELCPGPLTGLT